MPYVVPLKPTFGGSAHPRELIGGKGFNLGRLMFAGFPVPPGFVVTTDAFRRAVRGKLVGPRTVDEYRSLIHDLVLPGDVREAIRVAYGELTAMGVHQVAVRSSAIEEDSLVSSWAGQQESFVNVFGEASLLAHIKMCWASLFGHGSMVYGTPGGRGFETREMAVVVQALVPADTAGVIFTMNPMSGSRDEMVIASAYGLGEHVVQGDEADIYYVDKETMDVSSKRVGTKRSLVTTSDDEGTTTVAVPEELRAKESLAPETLRALATLGVHIEQLFGHPQDIEWAVAGGTISVLQTRAVTAAKSTRRSGGGGGSMWSNANVGEALPGVGTPFTWSIIHRFAAMGFTYAFGALGLAVPDPEKMFGNFWGRIYLNISEFAAVASQIPLVPPEELLAMGGVLVEPGLLDATYERRSFTRFLVNLPLTAPKVAFSHLLVPSTSKAWIAEFKGLEDEFYERDLERMTRQEVLDTMGWVTEVFNKTGTVMLAAMANALSAHFVLATLLKRWLGDDAGRLEKVLTSGIDGLTSAEPGLHLLKLAQIASETPELARIIREGKDADAILARIAKGGRKFAHFTSALRIFLNQHGHRAAREAELSTPRWREDQGFVMAIIRRHLEAPEIIPPERIIAEHTEVRRQAEREVFTRLDPVRSAMVGQALSLAKETAKLREIMRALVTETLGMYRRMALEVGRRLVADGAASRPEDAFFLTIGEMRRYLERLPLLDPSYLVAIRRVEYEIMSAMPNPPSTFVLRDSEMIPVARTVRRDPEGDEEILTGMAASAGRVTGRARVMRSTEDASSLAFGDIIVAPYTDVGWTPLFLIASAVVMEIGGPLSHSSIVAREYGKPAVVCVEGATTAIADGQLVTVDGDRGEVILHHDHR